MVRQQAKKNRSHSKRLGPLFTTALAITACTKAAPQEGPGPRTKAPQQNIGPYLVVLRIPTSAQKAYQFDADLEGTLLIKDGCVRIIEHSSNTRYTPIWEHATRVSADLSSIEVALPAQSPITLALGRPISTNGGHVPASWVNKHADPGPCAGPYWLMGFEITSP